MSGPSSIFKLDFDGSVICLTTTQVMKCDMALNSSGAAAWIVLFNYDFAVTSRYLTYTFYMANKTDWRATIVTSDRGAFVEMRFINGAVTKTVEDNRGSYGWGMGVNGWEKLAGPTDYRPLYRRLIFPIKRTAHDGQHKEWVATIIASGHYMNHRHRTHFRTQPLAADSYGSVAFVYNELNERYEMWRF